MAWIHSDRAIKRSIVPKTTIQVVFDQHGSLLGELDSNGNRANNTLNSFPFLFLFMPEQSMQSQHAEVKRIVSTLPNTTKRRWSNEELFHIANGYKHVLREANLPESEHEEKIRELIAHTKKLDFKTHFKLMLESLPINMNFVTRNLEALKRVRNISGLCDLDMGAIYLKRIHPAFLGITAAHEAAHLFFNETYSAESEIHQELIPHEIALNYFYQNRDLIKHALASLGKKKIRNIPVFPYRDWGLTPDPSHTDPETWIKAMTAGETAEKIREEAGEQKARDFLGFVRDGHSIEDAYRQAIDEGKANTTVREVIYKPETKPTVTIINKTTDGIVIEGIDLGKPKVIRRKRNN